MTTTRQQQNYNNQAAKYLHALKKGLQQTSNPPTPSKKYDDDVHDDLELSRGSRGSRGSRRNTSSSSTNSSKKSIVRRSERIQQKQQPNQPKQQQQQQQQQSTQQKQEAEEHQQQQPKQKQKQLTKRQQVLQRYAEEEQQEASASGAASVLASIADAAVTRSQLRNQNRVIWTERDRAFASEAAELALEIASAAAAKASTGRKKKEQPPAHLTRLEQKARSSIRFEKEMGRVHFDCEFV